MKTAIVIPTYNEADNIVSLINDIQRHSDAFIIIVDDQSPDGTAQRIKDSGNTNLHLIERSKKMGIGSAYQDGFKWALEKDFQIIGQMDADYSHDPKYIPQLINKLNNNDLVLGSRYIPDGRIIGWGPWRHFCSRSAMFVSKKILKLPVNDVTSGYRFWRKDLLKNILASSINSSGYAFQEEMLYRAMLHNARMVEHPIIFHDRRVGQSKLSSKDVVEFFWVLWKLKSGK